MIEVSWVDRAIKRFKDTGRLIPTTQRRLYMQIAMTWAIDKTIVDVGCSIGVGSSILSKVAQTVWGIDVNEEAIAFANLVFDRPGLDFAILDIENSQGRELSTFDVIVAIELLEHLADYRAGLATLKRFFSWQSVGLISIPNIGNEQTRLRDMDNELHLHRWSANQFRELMEGNFQSVRLHEEGTLLMAEVAGARQRS